MSALARSLGLVLVALAAAADAQVINPTATAALVHVPYLTDGAVGDRITVAAITNTDPVTPFDLHVTWIDGASWDGIDFNCPITPLETTWFIFEAGPTPGTTLVSFECSRLGQSVPDPALTNDAHSRVIQGTQGIMMVAVEAATGNPAIADTLPSNVLLADATIFDFGRSTAVSVPAVHVQAIAPNADRLYLYDGNEYAFFPTGLMTSYIAPDAGISAELVLYTPDGTLGGGPGVLARLDGFAFDDDENGTSGDFSFDCFVVKSIDAGDAFGDNVRREFGGHFTGHLELYPSIVVRRDLHNWNGAVSDFNPARVPPVHGWIIQTFERDGTLAGGGFGPPTGIQDDVAWGRQLIQSLLALAPLGGDTAGTDAR